MTMRAIRVAPGRPASATTTDVPEGAEDNSLVRVRTLLVGLCGTDRDTLGRQPSEPDLLTIGHEVLGAVEHAPSGSGFHRDDLVVGIIRSRCSPGCLACTTGQSDLCPTFPLIERGIYGADGYGSDEWSEYPDRLVRVPCGSGRHLVLAEPLSSVIKAGRRLLTILDASPLRRRGHLVITGAGPIGLLAAWHLAPVFDEVTVVDPKRHAGSDRFAVAVAGSPVRADWSGVGQPDAVLECSGATAALEEAVRHLAIGGVAVVEGIPDGGQPGLTAEAVRTMAFHDLCVMGTINGSIDDYKAAVQNLAQGPAALLDSLITREISPDLWPSWATAPPDPEDIKVAVRFST